MFLVIVGAALVGCVGLGVLYDYVARRRGRNESFNGSFGTSGGTPSIGAQVEHNLPPPGP